MIGEWVLVVLLSIGPLTVHGFQSVWKCDKAYIAMFWWSVLYLSHKGQNISV